MNFKAMAEENESWIIEQRRYFHAHPELSFAEKNTTQQIGKLLEEMGLTPHYYPDYNRLWAMLEGGKASTGTKTVALRADIDALPVEEHTGLSFCSQTPGVMHACGHDGHITGLLGAASVLKEMESELTVRVKLIFQPSEENTKGAKQIISQGILEDVDEVFGLHLFSDIKAGEISVEPGARMAQTDRFTITFIGKGGHAAKPHQCVDATVMAADFVMNVQTIVARELDPIEGAVVTVGSLKSGTQYNIISGKAVLEGTCRSYSEDVAQHLQDAIRRRAEAVADSYGGNVKIAYEQGSHPPVLNDAALSRRIADEAEQLLENRKLVHIAPLMLGEDFSWYQKEVPGVFAFVGCGTPGRKCYPNHHPKFEVEESALSDGVLLHLAAVVSAMHREKEE